MADNVTVPFTGSGDVTAIIATEDIGLGIQIQRNKVAFGIDGTATDVSAADPLPVTSASLPLPTGAATSAKQDTGNTSLESIDGKITAVNTGAVVVASSALPTGASTSAKQPALGTAGAASADVLTVQGIASMTPLLVTPTTNAPVNVAQINGVTPLMGAGNTGTGSPRVSIATDDVNLAAINAVSGTTADAAVAAGASGSISAKLRSISRDLIANIVLAAGANLIGFVGRKNTYAAKSTITVTLTSLTNTSKRESTAFFSAAYVDYLIRLQTKGQASSTAYVNVYVYEALGDTTYTGNATGTDAAYTGVLGNTRFLGAILMNAATTAVQAAWKLSDVMVTVPNAGGLIFDNESGATLSATAGDHIAEFSGVN